MSTEMIEHFHPAYNPGFSPFHPEHACRRLQVGPCLLSSCNRSHTHECHWPTQSAPFHKCSCNFIWSDFTKAEADRLLEITFNYLDMIHRLSKHAEHTKELCENARGHFNRLAHGESEYRPETRAEFKERLLLQPVMCGPDWRGRLVLWLATKLDLK